MVMPGMEQPTDNTGLPAHAIKPLTPEERVQLESANAGKKQLNVNLPIMNKETILQSCMENNGYELPELNEKLYLHFKGYQRIDNLDEYTGCLGLFLESNGFTKIQGLAPVVNLRCLYLQQNLIEKIEGISHLVNLVTLDLSQNKLISSRYIDRFRLLTCFCCYCAKYL